MKKELTLSICLIAISLVSVKIYGQNSELRLASLTQPRTAKTPKSPFFGSPNGGITSVSFVGSGDIQKSFSEGTDITANTGVGVIFERRWNKDRLIQEMKFDLNINIASTADTIVGKFENQNLINRRDFGSYLLIPINSKQSANFDFNLFFGGYDKYKWARIVSGLNFRFNASNSIWMYDNKVVNLSAFSTRLGLFHEFMPDEIRHNERTDYSIKLGMAYSFRGLFGDLSSTSNTSIRTEFLGTDKTKFSGIEFLLGFRLKNLSAEIQIPILKNRNSEVAGLTNTQFVTSIRFVGGFSLIFEKSDQEVEAME